MDASTTQGSTGADALSRADPAARILPILSAAFLGLLLLYAAGFASVDTLHDAAHDSRHSASFPCH